METEKNITTMGEQNICVWKCRINYELKLRQLTKRKSMD